MLDLLLGITILVLLGVLGFFLAGRMEESEPGRRRSLRDEQARLRLLYSAAAAAVVALVALGLGGPTLITAAVAAFAGVGSHVLLAARAARQDLALELNLAAAVDLMVASLRAGAALVDSLSTAAAESQGPTGDLLQELCDRVRVGDAPSAVLFDLVDRYPQEGVRLFAFTLASHFNSGGSVGSSLAEVARTIRDRADVVRRSNSQAVETQASVAGILVITYGLAFLMWRQYPERMDGFLSNDIGLTAVGISILLQALGVAWISRTIRVEV